MSETSSRVWKTSRDLALAMLNATLILIALCLFLAWRLASTVNDFAGDVAQNLISVEPLREDVRAMTDEIADLRRDLASISAQSGDLTSDAAVALRARIDTFDARLSALRDQANGVRDRIEAVMLDPAAILDHAIAVTTQEISDNVAAMVGCVPDRPVTPDTAPVAG